MNVVQALTARGQRASTRLRGLASATALLEAVHTPSVRMWALHSFAAAMRACAFHPLHKVNGCPAETRAALVGQFGKLLALFGRLLEDQLRAEASDVHLHALSLVGPVGPLGAGVGAGAGVGDVSSPSQVRGLVSSQSFTPAKKASLRCCSLHFSLGNTPVSHPLASMYSMCTVTSIVHCMCCNLCCPGEPV